VQINPDDMVDTAEAAQLIGLTNGNGVSTYRKRYADFPVPVIEKGRCLLWWRKDIERWSAGHRRQRGPEPRPRKQ
jgi:hypothetical protein